MKRQIKSNEHRKKITQEFDKAFEICESEYYSIIPHVDACQKEFLMCWNRYKKSGQHKEFLKISGEFATLLQIQNKMFKRNGSRLNPILAKFEKITSSKGDFVE